VSVRNWLFQLAESRFSDRGLTALGGRGAVLAYHGVVPNGRPAPALHIDPSTIERHFVLFKGRGYSFLRLGEFIRRIEQGASVKRCVAVTFDDAYAGVLELMPLLGALGVPATIFVPTGLIGSREPFWWDLLDLVAHDDEARSRFIALVRGEPLAADSALRTWEEIRTALLDSPSGTPGPTEYAALARAAIDVPDDALRPMTWADLESWMAWEGADCAPHTVNHSFLPALSAEGQEYEIRASFDRLAETFERTLRVVAYPYGLYDATSLAAARSAGMRAGVTMDRFGAHPREVDPMRIPRLPYSGATRPERLGLALSGVFRRARLREMPGGFPVLPGHR